MLKAVTFFVLTAAVLSVPYSALASVVDAGNLSSVSRKEGYRLTKLTDANDCFEADLEYPVFGRTALDQGVHVWAEHFFAQESANLKRHCAEMGAKPERRWEFAAGPQVFSTPGTVSIEFGIYYDTGGAHPGHGVRTLILDAEGKELAYGDLFLKTEGLWKFLSEYAYTVLGPVLKKNACWDPSWVKRGLAPNAESFKYVVVTPKGLTLIFPEYQLASYVCGGHSCDVPLKALTKFSPKPGVWDSATGLPTMHQAFSPSEKTQAPHKPARRFSPSFDCAKATNSVEHAICANPVLAELDVTVAADYKKVLSAVAKKEILRAEQRQWLHQMHTQCAAAADFQCIQQHYNKRLTQLRAYTSKSNQGGLP